MHKFNVIFYLGLDPWDKLLDICGERDPFFNVYLQKGNYYTTKNFENNFPGDKFDYIAVWDIFHRSTKTHIKRILEMSVDHMHKRSMMVVTYAHMGLKENFVYQDRDIIAICENRGLIPVRLNFLHPEGHTILLLRKGR